MGVLSFTGHHCCSLFNKQVKFTIGIYNNINITEKYINMQKIILGYSLLSCAVIKLDDSVCLILLNLVPCSGTDDSDPEFVSGTGGTI